MRRNLIIWITLLCGLLAGADGRAQLLYPGDFDGNGRVEQYDLLYFGYAFNTLGPPRTESDVPTSAGVFVAAHWAQQFPDGTNFGTVDADGNGRIDLADFSFLSQNYGVAWQPSPQEVVFSPGVPGVAPPLAFAAPADDTLQCPAGVQMVVPLYLGTADLPVTALNGLAFRIEYDPTYFSEVHFAFPGADSWLGPAPSDTVSGELFFQRHDTPGHIDVAYTRLGANGIDGEGPIGTLSFIVVEDMVDLLPAGSESLLSHIQISGVWAVDEDFQTRPIALQDLPLYLLAEATSSLRPPDLTKTKVFPNPTRGPLSVQSEIPFVEVSCLDGQGKRRTLYRGASRSEWIVDLSPLPPGWYWIRLEFRDGRREAFPVLRQ